MIPLSLNVYILVLATLAISLFALSAVFTFLLRRKFIKNIKEEIANIFPIVSPMLDNSIIWADLSGSISFINDYASKLLKINLEDFKDLKLKSIFESEIDAEKIRLLESGKLLKMQTVFVSSSKEAIPVELSAILVTISKNPIGYILIADNLHVKEIKELKIDLEKYKKLSGDQENNQKRYEEKINNLYNVMDSLFGGYGKTKIGQRDILKRIIEGLGAFFDSYLTTCWIIRDYSNDGEDLELIGQYGLSAAGIKKISEDLPTGDKMMKSMMQKQIFITDVSSLRNSTRTILAEEGISVIAEVPFLKNGKIFGILEFYLKNDKDIELNKQILSHVSTLMSAICSIFDIELNNSEEIKICNQEKNEEINSLLSKIEFYEKDMEEMRNFQELAVGRELRIIELKDEINKLENNKDTK